MTWSEFEEEVKKLSAMIDFPPDYIVGIVRGGVIPARLLSTSLKVNKMYCLTVTKTGETRKLATEIADELKNKRILLVEDMLETGKSLIIAKEYLESKGAIVKTACLYTVPISEIKPDYYLKEVKQTVQFPWE